MGGVSQILTSRSTSTSLKPGPKYVNEITMAILAVCGRVIDLENNGEVSNSELFDCGKREDFPLCNFELGQQAEVWRVNKGRQDVGVSQDKAREKNDKIENNEPTLPTEEQRSMFSTNTPFPKNLVGVLITLYSLEANKKK
jgi:hypothetical protein